MDRKLKLQEFTLIELVIVIFVVVALAALLLPALRDSRIPSRRNSCMNNIKQIGLALQNYADRRKSFPIASTSPVIDPAATAQRLVGRPSDFSADPPLYGDGWSWLFQILPEMENQPLYDRVCEHPASNGLAAFDPAIVIIQPGQPGAENPYALQQQMETYRCPTYSGAVETKVNFPGLNRQAAVGNYVAMTATHYNVSGVAGAGGAVDGPANWIFASGAKTLKQRQGNGALIFSGALPPDARGGRRGVGFAELRDGTSNTILFGESREEHWSAWMSGFSSYVVAVPIGQTSGVQRVVRTGPQDVNGYGANVLTLKGVDGDYVGQIALNKGGEVAVSGGARAPGKHFYAKSWPHGYMYQRIWGPSSAHAGIVHFGFGDGHGEAIQEGVDPDVFLHRVTRAGREIMP